MKLSYKKIYSLIAAGICLIVAVVAQYLYWSNNDDSVYNIELSSEAAGLTYGSIQPTKELFVEKNHQQNSAQELLDHNKLLTLIAKYNTDAWPKLNSTHDPIDIFISALPASYRSHYSMIHRSFSIQKASPLSPRVILYGPDAKIMMTFNAGTETDGKKMQGGNSIEIIEWNSQKLEWEFSELVFDQNKKLTRELNPAKCVMCHAGTPKPVNYKNIEAYTGKLKPIFPQYPFWPGFYGSVNDIVGLNIPNSRDTIMRNLQMTFNQVKTLTFGDTEELFRLRKLLDENPKYLELVKQEQDIHLNNFEKLINSMPQRNRYRHLINLKDLYKQNNLPVPEYLKSAPYRRTFDKEYGHYLLRPNFYLTSLMSFYQASFIAQQIIKTDIFSLIKYSLLARKYNCGPVQIPGMSINELDPSFDLLYPNLSTKESRDKQYLLAYQYNLEAAAKANKKPLPLYAWNIEGNEDIASYHYGNVFSDLNELVLWNLAKASFQQLTNKNARSAAEERHYALPNSMYLKNFLDQAGGFVSRMNERQMNFSQTLNNYYSSTTKFKALPVSIYCDSLFIPAAKEEMQKLLSLKQQGQLPHQVYKLDERLYRLEDIIGAGVYPGLNMVRQACESCHSDNSLISRQQIEPRLNVDWYSDTYFQDLKNNYLRFNSNQNETITLKQVLDEVLNKNTLPVPYSNAMPFGRRQMEDFALQCEHMIMDANYNSNVALKGKTFNCDKTSDQNSFNCRCKKLNILKDKLHREFFINE